MALGIGSVTAMFSVANAVLLRPMPFGDPARLKEVRTISEGSDSGVAAGDFDQLRTATGIASATLIGPGAVTLTGAEGAENAFSERLAGDGLAVYGVAPAAGSLKSWNDRSVVLSHRLWKRRYAEDPSVIGRSITINGESWTVAAVMPASFSSGNRAHLWMPWRFSERDLRAHGEAFSHLIVRLRPDAQEQAVAAALLAIARQHQPDRYAKLTLRVRPVEDRVIGKSGQIVWTLMGAVSLVLIIACLNAGSLLVAQRMARQKETAVRWALGARRRAILRPILAESAMLAAIASLVGTFLAWAIVRLAMSQIAERTSLPLPRFDEASIDVAALAIAVMCGLVSLMLASVGPALSALRVSPAAVFGNQGRSATAGRSSVRFAIGATTLQIALSVTLLVGAGLLLRSLYQLIDTDPGYQREGVLTARVPMPFDSAQRFGGAAHVAHYQSVLETVRAIPGVRHAAVTTVLPLGRVSAAVDFKPEGRPDPPRPEYFQASGVTPDYFRVMGIPLREGRWFDDRDTVDAEPVIIINEVTARRFWPGESAIGKRVSGNRPMTIVGVVGPVRRSNMRETPKDEIYRPFSQFLFGLHGATLVIRTSGPPPESLVAPVRSLLTRNFPNHPVAEVRPMAAWIDESVEGSRVSALLLSGFATLALAITVIGVYGSLSHMTTLRRREIGIRIAVGASPSQIMGTIAGRGLAMVGAGVAAGALCSLASGSLLRTQLYGVEPGDPVTLGAVALLFVTVAAAAMASPAWRASRTDPVAVLRTE